MDQLEFQLIKVLLILLSFLCTTNYYIVFSRMKINNGKFYKLGPIICILIYSYTTYDIKWIPILAFLGDFFLLDQHHGMTRRFILGMFLFFIVNLLILLNLSELSVINSNIVFFYIVPFNMILCYITHPLLLYVVLYCFYLFSDSLLNFESVQYTINRTIKYFLILCYASILVTNLMLSIVIMNIYLFFGLLFLSISDYIIYLSYLEKIIPSNSTTKITTVSIYWVAMYFIIEGLNINYTNI